ncbi:elongation factor P 5-aminopentanone reductase [Lacticaseibacillus brantae]|nr:SDR family oxidoreductase [Lacticaseibacillus brantae]
MPAALILGASGDIGQAISRRLAADGWSLYLHYFSHEQVIAALQSELQATYPQQDFLTLQADLSDLSQLNQITENIFSLDAVVFAAGVTAYGLLVDIPVAQIEALTRMHLVAPMALLTQLQSKLARSGSGRVVFIGSVYGGRGSAMEVPYSTVKGAQSAFVRAYSQEVASLGMTVNVVAPGAVATKMNQMFDADTMAAVQAEIPAARLATPQDISYYVTMLCQPEAAYMTGQTLYVTGGWRQ